VLGRPGSADYLHYAALFLYDEGDPLDQPEHEQVCDLDPVETAELKIGIRKQVERKSLCLTEGDVCIRPVGADTEDQGIVPFEFAKQIAEPASLRGSAGRTFTGEEEKHDVLLPDEIVQADDPAILCVRGESRRRAADNQHLPLLLMSASESPSAFGIMIGRRASGLTSAPGRYRY
jgi:hypothetical protein